tara:strand:- start:1652 stop:2563 length:912 start_codon:yes stop_codon:yes gene_type:complete
VKYKLLIIGYSGLVRRRVISTLVRNNIPYDVASRSKIKQDKKAQNWYHGYDKALKNSDASIAYISLPNSMHYYWGLKALKKGFHTLIDKPATINSKQLKKLISISNKSKKILSESVFFNYHKQMKFALNQIKKDEIISINANFLIPKPSKDSIHSSRKLKGGVIMDMGPYIAALSRLFFKSLPEKIIKNVDYRNKISSKLEILFIYKGSYFVGKFSHDDEYKNFIKIYSKNKVIELSRVFSPPALENLKVLETKFDKINTKVFSDDVFKNYIEEVFKLIKAKKFKYYQKQMIYDIKIRESIQK